MMKPDWKNAEDYIFLAHASLDLWAAQFLWRNTQFRKEIEAALDEPDLQTPPIAWNETQLGKVFDKYGASPRLPEWVEKGVCDSHMVFEKHPQYVPSYKVTAAGGLFKDKAVGQRYCVALESPKKVVLEFDLVAPINPQIERAKRMLMAQQERNNKGKKVVKKAIVLLYPWYLRILDAGIAGATHSEMIDTFSKEDPSLGDDTLSKRKKEAERLRDYGYRELVTRPL